MQNKYRIVKIKQNETTVYITQKRCLFFFWRVYNYDIITLANGCGEPWERRIPNEYTTYAAAEDALKAKIKETKPPTIEKEILRPDIW